jgi:hypothetical protein
MPDSATFLTFVAAPLAIMNPLGAVPTKSNIVSMRPPEETKAHDVNAPGAGTREYQLEEHKAVENRGLAAVQDGEEALRCMRDLICEAISPERTKATGRVKRPRTSSAPPISSNQAALQDVDDEAHAGQDQEQQHPGDLIACRGRGVASRQRLHPSRGTCPYICHAGTERDA